MTNGYARMQQQAGAAGGKGGAISCPGMIIRFFLHFSHFFFNFEKYINGTKTTLPYYKTN